MRTEKEILQKQKKFRKKLRKRIVEYGTARKRENCVYWLKELPGDAKCVYPKLVLRQDETRECQLDCGGCSDFKRKYTDEDLHEKYLSVVNNPDYLARNYRDLFILSWVLENPEPSFFEKLFSKIYIKWMSMLDRGKINE